MSCRSESAVEPLYAAPEAHVPEVTDCSKPQLVLIGVSTGGPNALHRLFSTLPTDLGVPILVVQHMPPLFTRTLAESLSGNTRHIVREALEGECLAPNCVYIAPGGKQMRLMRGPNGTKTVRITDDAPENNCKPCVDYLFRSVATEFPGEALAVILTGMGNDGSGGLRLLKRGGCQVLAQDESTCVVFGMPKAAIDSGLVDAVLPIDEIGPRVARIVRGVAL
jgi:two-component system chemotaxis response regulator CheB